MSGLFVCCSLFASLLTFNPSDGLLKNSLAAPAYFLQSIFSSNSLPAQTKNAKSYTIALVGDSMTHTLSTADPLRDALKSYYPEKEFGILNFGIGATSILTVPERLLTQTQREDEGLPAILDTKPDIILLESMGNNPLSELPLSEGLKKQNETLDRIVKIIEEERPKTVLIFVGTIAPLKEKYALGIVDLTAEQRISWANERIAYIKNHIKYAQTHNISLINLFDISQTESGEGRAEFISQKDFIHPSQEGIEFIQKQIADFIFNQKIIPR
ncbi:MAG: hypothetical protein ACD_32C00145G0009 [uncultured bacterium]|uniref:SGNH hydrolase-type esterase domain-containing protein n=1 Tax=Candidatus Daviesbacteria bacterium GW2011_GWC2_40_12 TaxID=1618431 RepID=A0A0G0TSE3_9BACT|nr:MAG: hypothetical protein ACD_32C00145G0009 [uncultured bacterium]KKQ81084.1 MAG: hypothetical protein UT04_C0084G0002 [Candidatus Daviesbacteria bacterium GW2011_GWF2_38_7]KKR24081.1 MAG: hypothetical protein UT54_C0031G0006 [Candidatus Daviesbacteria bacterium GW2011_GWB1_39_5]KKR40777.1 MAG: hypothetical protein UT77_C0019G0009 [Candidatus Daviesbacteria bacterium GW2011_GWC2_40_12]OGE22448.1 MAG: hypothetical protein A2778_00115 [Candidatus Daviesbacteria bacterium RIFCSPHIGHO2_01_FULL_4